MKKGDLYIILITLFIFLSIFGMYQFMMKNISNKRYVEIYMKKELITSIELTENTNQKILILSKDNVFQEKIILDTNETMPENLKGFDLIYIYNNGVQVIEADCPRRFIVKQGFMKYSNIPLICLPRQLVVKIKAQDENTQIDGISS